MPDMSYNKPSAYQHHGGSSSYQVQYANVQQRPVASDYPSPSYSHNGSHAMSQNGSRSSNSSHGSGRWGPQTSASTSYGLLSPAASPRESYFSTTAQLEGIDFDLLAPVSRHKSGSTKRSSKKPTTTDTNNPTTSQQEQQSPQFPCLSPDCPYSTDRHHDLKRHMNKHSKITTFPCKYNWCRRGSGEDDEPFKRKDNLTEHMRNVHQMPISRREKGPRKEGKGGQ